MDSMVIACIAPIGQQQEQKKRSASGVQPNLNRQMSRHRRRGQRLGEGTCKRHAQASHLFLS